MILNITYLGRSADYPVDAVEDLADEDVRRVAIEVVRAGGVDGGIVEISDDAFVNYVIDRMVDRIYLRPKVPFGSLRSPSEESGVRGWEWTPSGST